MKLGINTFTFMWAVGLEGARPENPLTPSDLLDKAKELGVSLLQMGPNLPLEKRSKAEISEFKHKADALGITLEMGTRGLETRVICKQVDLCQQTGSRFIRTVPEIAGKIPPLPDLVKQLQKLRPILESEGIRLGLENHNMPAGEMKSAIDVVGSANIGVVLDTVNSLAVPEGWKEVTRILAPCTMCLHYKDFIVQRVWSMMGFTCSGKPAGKGQLDASWLLNALQASAFDFNVILEIWTPEQKTLDESIRMEWDWAIESIAYLRDFIEA